MRSYSPGGVLNALASALIHVSKPTPSTHRLRRGLPGYLILFAPHAFAPQRQLWTRKPPSLPVFFLISTHFTATPGIPLSSSILKKTVSKAGHKLSLWVSPLTCFSAYALFTPNNSGQRLPPPYYRGCWHGVSRGFLWRYRQTLTLFTSMLFFPPNRALRSLELHHPRGVAASAFRPLRNIPHCCLP